MDKSGVIVAPHAGAWIEISGAGRRYEIDTVSLPMRERGLKLSVPGCGDVFEPCRSPCGSVD